MYYPLIKIFKRTIIISIVVVVVYVLRMLRYNDLYRIYYYDKLLEGNKKKRKAYGENVFIYFFRVLFCP